MVRRSRAAVPTVVGAVVLASWCGWVSGFHRSTTPARVTWGISLLAVGVVDLLFWQGRHGRRPGWPVAPSVVWPEPGRRPSSVWAGMSPWLVLAAGVAAWDVLGIDTGAHVAHLTISALTQAFRPLNAAMLLVWMAVGIGYGATRARSPRDHAEDARRAADDNPAATASGAFVAVGTRAVKVHASGTLPALLLPNNRAAGVAFWLCVPLVVVIIDQVARRSGRRLANAEEFLRVITNPLAAKLFWILAWAYAGYHLFAH